MNIVDIVDLGDLDIDIKDLDYLDDFEIKVIATSVGLKFLKKYKEISTKCSNYEKKIQGLEYKIEQLEQKKF